MQKLPGFVARGSWETSNAPPLPRQKKPLGRNFSFLFILHQKGGVVFRDFPATANGLLPRLFEAEAMPCLMERPKAPKAIGSFPNSTPSKKAFLVVFLLERPTKARPQKIFMVIYFRRDAR